MKKILPVFSYLFHPLFIPVLALIYFFILDVNILVPAEKYLLLIQVVIVTILIPISFYFLLRSLGKIDSAMAHETRERKAPLLMHALLVYLLLRQSVTFDMVPELYYFFLGVLLSTMAALVLLFFELKVSLHMMGMGGFLFFVIGIGIHNGHNIGNLAAFWLVMAGLTASSRLVLKAHSFRELMFGFFFGILPQVALWHFWL
ncbi:MAG TPA: hypothetical protein VGB43_01130 [Flavobacterium sp.]